MTPVEELRAAANLIREVAGKATPGPWGVHVAHTGIRSGASYAWVMRLDGQGPIVERQNGGTVDDVMHIAMWHPVVALAVADWLDDEARWPEAAAETYGTSTSGRIVLALARAINGGAS